MFRYLDLLTNQYMRAMGLNRAYFESEEFALAWSSWLDQIPERTRKYYDFLKETGMLPYNQKSIAEIGKSELDTLAAINNDITIISPYTLGYEATGAGKVIRANFKILNDKPYYVKKDINKPVQVRKVSPVIKTFETHNPYNIGKIYDWDKLSNSGKKDIIIGAYGSIADQDRLDKIQDIEFIKEKLLSAYTEVYATYGDTYCYGIATNQNQSRKVR